VSWDHPVHGFLFPEATDGPARPDQVQNDAIDGVIAFLDRHLQGSRWASRAFSGAAI